MGVFIYDIAAAADNEAVREAAVVASGALALMDHPSLQSSAREAARAFATRFASISIIVRDWQYLIAAHGIPTGVTRRSSSFCAHAILQPRRPFVVLDARHDERFAENPSVVDAPAIRFYAGAALLHDADTALGALCVFDPHPRGDVDRREAAALTRHAAAVAGLIADLAADAAPRRRAAGQTRDAILQPPRTVLQ